VSWEQAEAFASGSLAKPIIKRGECVAARFDLPRRDRTGELHGIVRTQAVRRGERGCSIQHRPRPCQGDEAARNVT